MRRNNIVLALLLVGFLPAANAVYPNRNSTYELSYESRNNLKRVASAKSKSKLNSKWLFSAGYEVVNKFYNESHKNKTKYFVLKIEKEVTGGVVSEYLIFPHYVAPHNIKKGDIILLDVRFSNVAKVYDYGTYLNIQKDLMKANNDISDLLDKGVPLKIEGDLLDIALEEYKKLNPHIVATPVPKFTVNDYSLPLLSRVDNVNSYLGSFEFNPNLFKRVYLTGYESEFAGFTAYEYSVGNDSLNKEFEDYLFVVASDSVSKGYKNLEDPFAKALNEVIFIKKKELFSFLDKWKGKSSDELIKLKKIKVNLLNSSKHATSLSVNWHSEDESFIARDLFVDKSRFQKAIKRANEFYVPKYVLNTKVNYRYSVLFFNKSNLPEILGFDFIPAIELDWNILSTSQYTSDSSNELRLKERDSDSNLKDYMIVKARGNILNSTENESLKIIHKDDLHLMFDKYLALALWYYLPFVNTESRKGESLPFKLDEVAYTILLNKSKVVYKDTDYLKAYKLNKLKKPKDSSAFASIDIYSKGRLGKIIVPTSVNQLPVTISNTKDKTKTLNSTNSYLGISLMYSELLMSDSEKLNDVKDFE